MIARRHVLAAGAAGSAALALAAFAAVTGLGDRDEGQGGVVLVALARLANSNLLGERLGEAYQVADDIRDVAADPDELGKPVGRDAVLGGGLGTR